jgi:hypothetical protein
VNVRFGHDGSNAILWIAESTTSWDEVKISITDLLIGGSNDDYDDWKDGWVVEIDATTDTVQATISAELNATEFLGTTDDITEGSTNEYDKTVVLTGSGVAEITGTYPSFDINVDPIVNVPVAFFFSDTSYTAISGYYEMYYSEMGEAASNIPISINTSTWTEVGTWIQVPEIDADGFVVQGTGTFNLTCAVSGGGTSQQGQVRATIYLRDSGGTETELYSVSAVSVDSSVDSKILTYTVTDEEPYEATDRFVVKIEALAILTPNTADTFTLYMEDDYNSNWTLPVSSLYLSRNFQNRFRFQELTADYTVTNADRTNTVFAVTPSTVDITLSVTSADWTEGDTLSFMKKGTSSYDVIIEIDSSTFATLTLENQSLRIIKHDTSGGHFDIISDYNPATVSVPSSRTITVGDGLEIDNDSSADLSSDRTINLTVPTQVGTSNGIFFPYVDGGVEDFATGTASGWIKVLLPMTLSALTTLSANITVDLVFNLHDLTPVAYPEDMSCKIRVSGLLSYADSEWHYNKASVIEGKENNYEVKVGNDGTNFCFWITITDELSTPTFYLTDVMIGGTSVNYDDWAEGWSITNAVSLGTVDETIDANCLIPNDIISGAQPVGTLAQRIATVRKASNTTYTSGSDLTFSITHSGGSDDYIELQSNNYDFKALKAGVYLISGTVRLSVATTGNYISLYLDKNGSTLHCFGTVENSASQQFFNVTTLIYLGVDHYFSLKATTEGGVNFDLISAYTRFSIIPLMVAS